MGKELKKEIWFDSFLSDVNLSTTQYISREIPGSKFTLLEQEVSDSYIVRKIAFFVGDHVICQSTNKVHRNRIVDKWIQENPVESFGQVFRENNLHRVLLSKTKNSRRYSVTGDVHAMIKEKFYPLP